MLIRLYPALRISCKLCNLIVAGFASIVISQSGSKLNFGSYGLKARNPGRINARQIEAARRAITREMQREGRVWIRIFPDVPVSKKPAEVRMGKGKGSVEFWV